MVPNDANQTSYINRALLHPALRVLAGDEQHGAGLNGGSCDLAHIVISQNAAHGMARGISIGVAFLDISSAFASTMRPIAIPGDDASDATWLQYLCDIGLQPEDVVATVQLACDTLRWIEASASGHELATLVEAHSNIWLSMEGV